MARAADERACLDGEQAEHRLHRVIDLGRLFGQAAPAGGEHEGAMAFDQGGERGVVAPAETKRAADRCRWSCPGLSGAAAG